MELVGRIPVLGTDPQDEFSKLITDFAARFPGAQVLALVTPGSGQPMAAVSTVPMTPLEICVNLTGVAADLLRSQAEAAGRNGQGPPPGRPS